MTIAQSAPQFRSLQESANQFLGLFPHRFDYIWAPFPDLGEPVAWQTESRHLLSDRLIGQGAYLYGVRFGSETCYAMLDIDYGSQYHPRHDRFAITRICAALEPLGLVSYVACTSSYSNGLHLYFPFPQAQNSWKLAIAISTLLENAGFKVKPGQLEVFPDPKPYTVQGKLSLFNAHRLPLQIGSYLVNVEFETVWSTQESFVQQWRNASLRNDVNAATIRRVLKQVKRDRYQVSTKAEKFINDLNAEIELGWTDFGQTNYLLGRITMREYIFRHILTGGNPLVGNDLVEAIVNIAQSLPGYFEYCRHRHEIHHRAQEWAQCIENSHYFHYGDAAGKFQAKSKETGVANVELEQAIADTPNWNQQQSDGARERIRRAIAQLLDQGTLPTNATARFHALVRCGIGGGTLYKHRDLWHPNYFSPLEESAELESVENENFANLNQSWDCCEAASHDYSSSSLFLDAGRNTPASQASSDLPLQENESGRNDEGRSQPWIGEKVQHELKAVQEARQAALQTAFAQQQHSKQQAAEARQIVRMQQYLASNDPILMAEAIAWMQFNPGVIGQIES